MKKTRLFFLSFVMVITITMLSGCGKDKTNEATAETTTPTLETMSAETTTAPMSDEELLAKFSSMVESEVEKQLSATTAETTVPATVTEKSTDSVTEKKTDSETDILNENSNSTVNTSLIEATLLHRGSEYSLYVEPGIYEAAFKSRFLGKGRSLEILLDTNCKIDTIRVHEAFNGDDDFLSFEQINKLDFSETDSGYSFSYEIPDNPSGKGYNARTNFLAVFEIVDADGNIYCTSISY